MLSYLHAFHAGNPADVLKHSALLFCLAYLKKKEKPLLCVDTHSGSGSYILSDTGSTPNREWEKGIGLLLKTGEKLPAMLADYAAFCAPSAAKGRYLGSSEIMAALLQKRDRLVAFELHPQEAEALKAVIDNSGGEKPAIEVRHEDGHGGLKSLLPPPSRRGLVLMDPSWEEMSEYESIPHSVKGALKRFAEGTYIVWYPLLALPKEKGSQPLPEILYGLSDGKRCRAELCTGRAENSPRGMYGSGIVIFNPPWTLKAALEESLPCLAEILGGEEGSWRLDWDG